MHTQRAASVMQLVGSHAKSAKKSALRVAEENGITNGKFLELGKAKAQSLFSQVQESVSAKRGSSTRRNSVDKKPSRAKSAGPLGTGGKTMDEELIAKVMDIGVSPVAARLALSKCEGIAKTHKMDVACNWLLDEKNRDEIEAAENAEIEKSAADQMASSEVSREGPGSPCEEMQELVPNRSPPPKRRVSTGSDDGRGLGFFMSRKSLPSKPSPRNVPQPGRLSRGSFGSSKERVSTGSADSAVEESRPSLARRVSIGSQTSTASEEFHPAMTPRGDDAEDQPSLAQCAGDEAPCEEEARTSVAREAACMDEDEPEVEEEEDEEEDVAPPLLDPLPPGSSCWDWPLSRHEKKARVQMLERQMNAMDRRSLIKECSVLRRDLRKASLGGASGRPSTASSRPSRLST